jgi:hypothetical protein
LNLHFQNQKKFENIWLVLTIHACGLHYLTFLRGKQAEKSTQLGESFQGKMSQKSSALSILFEGGEGPCNLNSQTLPPNNHNLFCEIGLKKGEREKRKIRDH